MQLGEQIESVDLYEKLCSQMNVKSTKFCLYIIYLFWNNSDFVFYFQMWVENFERTRYRSSSEEENLSLF